MLAVTEHADDSDQVEGRKHVHDADEVARHCLEKGDLAPGVLDYAQLEDHLPRCLTILKRFKKSEIAPIHQEMDENDERYQPLLSAAGEFAGHGLWRGSGDEDEDQYESKIERDLEQGVGEDGEEAAADAGDREAEGYLLRRVDSKLILTQRAVRVVRGEFSHPYLFRRP